MANGSFGTWLEPGLDRLGLGEGFLDGWAKDAEMAHFPSGARLPFSIQVQFRVRVLENLVPVGLAVPPEISEKIDHDGWREEGG